MSLVRCNIFKTYFFLDIFLDQGKVQRKVSRRSSSLARRSRGQGDTLHPKTGGRSKEQGQGHGSRSSDLGSRNREELRMGIQARMRMMMAQKETIEKELLKLQVKEEDQEHEQCCSRIRRRSMHRGPAPLYSYHETHLPSGISS